MKPILFSAQDVKALLNTKPGTYPAEPIKPSRPCKSQARRVVKPQPIPVKIRNDATDYLSWDSRKSRYQVGDKLWVRESHVLTNHGNPVYKADFRDKSGDYWSSIASDPKGVKWRPSIHMPREAARLFLEIREVRVERLRDISEIDCLQEGVQGNCVAYGPIDESCNESCMGCHEVNRTAFKKLWNAANGKDAWESNPWVWVYGFMRVEG